MDLSLLFGFQRYCFLKEIFGHYFLKELNDFIAQLLFLTSYQECTAAPSLTGFLENDSVIPFSFAKRRGYAGQGYESFYYDHYVASPQKPTRGPVQCQDQKQKRERKSQNQVFQRKPKHQFRIQRSGCFMRKN